MVDYGLLQSLGAGLLGTYEPGGFLQGFQQDQGIQDQRKTSDLNRSIAQKRLAMDTAAQKRAEEEAALKNEAMQRANEFEKQRMAAIEQASSLLQPNPMPPLMAAGMTPQERTQGAASLLAPYDQHVMNSLLDAQGLGNESYGKELSFARGPNGEIIGYQASSKGGIKEVEVPKGFQFMLPQQWLNLGDRFAPAPSRDVPGSSGAYQKNLSPEDLPSTKGEQAEKTAEGKLTGEQKGMLQGKIDALDSVREASSLLSKGIYTGIYANAKLTTSKAIPFIDKSKASNTEQFKSHIGNVVIPRLKEFGGNDSNEELRYLQSVMAGDITVEGDTLKRILQSVEEKMSRNVERLKTGKQYIDSPPDMPAPTTKRRYNPATGKIE